MNDEAMNQDLRILSRNIKYLRTRKGISQEDLAADIYLARSTYADYENGVKTPDLQTLDALAAVHDVDFEAMMNPALLDSLMERIYFDQSDKDLARLLSNYQSLSIAAKNIVAEDLKILLDRESIFYRSYSTKNEPLQEEARDDVDGDRNGDNGSDGAEE